MDIDETSYCRLCADIKPTNKLLNLQNDEKKLENMILMLAFVNAVYVDISEQDLLPKTICLLCYDSLIKAYDFLASVKRAQELLSTVVSSKIENKCNLSEDDVYECGGLETPDDAEVKVEIEANEAEDPDSSLDEVLVKKEYKLEQTDNYNQFNVEDILNAAAYTSSVTIEEKDYSDRVVVTWSDYPWTCAYCHIEFLNVDSLRTHAREVHSKCWAFQCIDCKALKKEDFASFIKHIRKHRTSLKNYCYYCNKLLDKSEKYKSHVKQHYPKPQRPCTLCGEIFPNEEMLKIHLQHFKTSSKQKRRPRRKPGTPVTLEDLTCKLCKKVYKNLNSLRDHKKLHMIDRKRNYTCDRCGKMFFNKGTLKSHIMSHDEIRPHVCKICNKSFLFPNMLRRHVEMHSGVKPFSCEQCGRCFRLQYQLNAHKIVHTDSMPYICPFCNKAFRFKQILKNHERQHTGAKPYACDHCGMEFTNWSNYNKHMKRRHNTDTSKKKITPSGIFPVNPETGQIIEDEDPVGTEEWKSRIMVPGKRGKKKVIKQEGT